MTRCMVRPCGARDFVDLADAVLHQCIRPLIGARCSGPSWISARMRSHYRTGLKRAIRVTSVRMHREDRSSIVVSSLADLRRVKLWLRHRWAPCFALFLCSCLEVVPSSRPAGAGAPRAGAVKAGRRAWLATCSSTARPRLDGAEHGASIKQVGTKKHGSSRTRRRALC